MSSIKMTALRQHHFGTAVRAAGEEYEATADESAILIALGWAEKAKAAKAAKEEGPPPAPAPAKKDLKAGAPATDQATGQADKAAYRTKDMKARD